MKSTSDLLHSEFDSVMSLTRERTEWRKLTVRKAPSDSSLPVARSLLITSEKCDSCASNESIFTFSLFKTPLYNCVLFSMVILVSAAVSSLRSTVSSIRSNKSYFNGTVAPTT